MPNQFTLDDDHKYKSNNATQYEFKDTTTKPTLKDRLSLRGKKSRRTNSLGSSKSTSSRSTAGTNNDDDGTGSLTYSATSSVATESSFDNIVKVLQQDGYDRKEITSLLKSRGIEHHRHTFSNGDEKSCAADSLAYSARSITSDSLAYSEEAESYMRMLAADGESTAHVSQVSLLQGTALLSNGQSEQSSQNAYSGLTPSYVNNGGGQRLDVTDEGNVFMVFSPAEHTEGMKRRKERKRRERNERKTNESKAKDSTSSEKVADRPMIAEQKTQDHGDVSSVAPTVVTPSKSKKGSTEQTSRNLVQGNPSPRSVSVLPIETAARVSKEQLNQLDDNTSHQSGLDDEYEYDDARASAIRGKSSRVIIHESRGQSSQTGNTSSTWTSRDIDSDSQSSTGFNIQQQCNVLRTYCEEMPTDDDDMFYSKWCSFCGLDTNQNTTSAKARR